MASFTPPSTLTVHSAPAIGYSVFVAYNGYIYDIGDDDSEDGDGYPDGVAYAEVTALLSNPASDDPAFSALVLDGTNVGNQGQGGGVGGIRVTYSIAGNGCTPFGSPVSAPSQQRHGTDPPHGYH